MRQSIGLNWMKVQTVLCSIHKTVCSNFDIVYFFPSTSEDILSKAIAFAKNIVEITDNELEIIMHARKSHLFKEYSSWVKKDANKNFDVTMGGYDGTEVCEVVGLHLLNALSDSHENKDIGRYRDDRLAILRNSNPQNSDRARKLITQTFKDNGL